MLSFLTDPVLQAPTIGSMCMAVVAGLIGVITFVRRQSLIGEVLSHAAYPGIVLTILLFAVYFPDYTGELWWIILIGAFVSALIGYLLLSFIQRVLRVNNDTALCLMLSSSLGIGVLGSSRLQVLHPKWLQEIHGFLCGQAATMTSVHVYIYGILMLLTVIFIVVFFRQIQMSSFDRNTPWMDRVIMGLVVVAVIVGIRSVGIVLMAGMFIAPAVAARAFTHQLKTMFVIAALIGAVSGFFGNVFSVYLSRWLMHLHPGWKISLPTGPMILGVAVFIAVVSLLIAPKKGLLARLFRIAYFRFRCVRENVLKFLWKRRDQEAVTLKEMQLVHPIASPLIWSILQVLIWENAVAKIDRNHYRLLPKGEEQARKIVRLHRLWEVYLHRHLGVSGEQVHGSAEELEHVLTWEMEEKLTALLDNPQEDPHHQPIPHRTQEEMS